MSIQSQIDEKCNCETETAALLPLQVATLFLRYSSFLFFFSVFFLRRLASCHCHADMFSLMLLLKDGNVVGGRSEAKEC